MLSSSAQTLVPQFIRQPRYKHQFGINSYDNFGATHVRTILTSSTAQHRPTMIHAFVIGANTGTPIHTSTSVQTPIRNKFIRQLWRNTRSYDSHLFNGSTPTNNDSCFRHRRKHWYPNSYVNLGTNTNSE